MPIPRKILTLLAVDTCIHQAVVQSPMVGDAAVVWDAILDKGMLTYTELDPVTTADSDLFDWFRWACPYDQITLSLWNPDIATENDLQLVYRIIDTRVSDPTRWFYTDPRRKILRLRCQFLSMLSLLDLLPSCY